MPTLTEVWLAEQTSERLPWQHQATSDCAVASETPPTEKVRTRRSPRALRVLHRDGREESDTVR